jgi:hypothetical protein
MHRIQIIAQPNSQTVDAKYSNAQGWQPFPLQSSNITRGADGGIVVDMTADPAVLAQLVAGPSAPAA